MSPERERIDHEAQAAHLSWVEAERRASDEASRYRQALERIRTGILSVKTAREIAAKVLDEIAAERAARDARYDAAARRWLEQFAQAHEAAATRDDGLTP